MNHRIFIFLVCCCAAFPGAAQNNDGNLNRRPGTTLHADSRYGDFSPARAADGDARTMSSRWVSDNAPGGHHLTAEYGKTVSANRIRLQFWNAKNIATDFDLQGRTADGWKMLRQVRQNQIADVDIAFPETAISALRINFSKTIPDNTVRLYEFSAFHEPELLDLSVTGNIGAGVLGVGDSATLRLEPCSSGSTPVVLRGRLTELNRKDATPVVEFEKRLKPDGVQQIALPFPGQFGSYQWEFSAKNGEGKEFRHTWEFRYFPPARPVHRTSSPFGVHFHHSNRMLREYAGISWWRNHDNFGRWNQCMTSAGKPDWEMHDQRLEPVKEDKLRLCSALQGAPRRYSTILPEEPAYSGAAPVYSFYPPSDFDAWQELYLKPMAERVSASSPFRAYQIWNEPWSYYRLRGLHSTPGEVMELIRLSYQTLKQEDPAALVFAADVKPEMIESRYSYHSFGRAMLELGYLRWADLVAFHSYGEMDFARLEKIRRNVWLFGRDYEMWSTETATPGKPFYRMMEALLRHRIYGNGKTFLYTGSDWAPLYRGNLPTMELIGLTALIRELGEAAPLGCRETEQCRIYLVANGAKAVAVAFTDSPEPVKITVPATPETVIRDVFGNRLAEAAPSLGNPVFISSPAPVFVRDMTAEQIGFYAQTARQDPSSALLREVAAELAATALGKLTDTVPVLLHRLDAARFKWRGNALYYTNFALDLLTNLRIMEACRRKTDLPTAKAAEVRDGITALWKQVNARTNGEGALLNTERLLSRAQKEYQYAMQYESDSQPEAHALHLERAAAELAAAQARSGREQIARIYKPRMDFRSHKRLLRSELYCFAKGKPQEAVITVANPFGPPLAGTLEVKLPEGWKADQTELPYSVAPYSRELVPLRLTAPAEAETAGKYTIRIQDRDNHLPEIAATCEVLEEIPPYPVLDGAISTGIFTGN